MRRTVMLLMVAALVTAMLALTAAPAFAQGLVSANLGKTSLSVDGLLNVTLGATQVGVL